MLITLSYLNWLQIDSNQERSSAARRSFEPNANNFPAFSRPIRGALAFPLLIDSVL
jgi:hypothetical protein